MRTEEWSISLQQRLVELGHMAFFTDKSLTELRMNLSRIVSMVKKTPAEAWIVCSGSREVLHWFSEQKTPAFALFGRRRGLPIAGVGPDHVASSRALTRRLIALGHQRIVQIKRQERREGGGGQPERAIFEEMEAQGLPVGPYNLPDWGDNEEGLHNILSELFRITPPTALILDEPFLYHATKDHLARQGILAPDHVSLICLDPDPSFVWCRPSVSHTHWDRAPVVNRVVRWASNIARGKRDRKQTLTKAEFVEGGSIGPAPKGR